ncbi:MAG: hypothetical protein MUP21_13390 [Dehalococcoidia bacterium]|nr:hypothetical protein [Dehalococcoidia bacterium]
METKKKPVAVRKPSTVQAINSMAAIPLLKGLAKIFGGEFIPAKVNTAPAQKPVATQKPRVNSQKKTVRAKPKSGSSAPAQNVGRPGRTEVRTNVTDLLKARDKKIKALDKELKARKTAPKEPILAGEEEVGIVAPKRKRKKPEAKVAGSVFVPPTRKVVAAKKQQA